LHVIALEFDDGLKLKDIEIGGRHLKQYL